jgi:hypothetical protein
MSETPKTPEQILFEAMGNGDWETEAEEVQWYYRSYVAAIRPQIEAEARAVAIAEVAKYITDDNREACLALATVPPGFVCVPLAREFERELAAAKKRITELQELSDAAVPLTYEQQDKIEELKIKLAEMDAWLGKRPCGHNRCVNLIAANERADKARAAAIEDAVSACKAEFLIEPNKDNDGDLSYDLAVSHCIEAIKTIAHN